MASLQDTIKILIQADGASAIREIEKVGKTAQRELDKNGKATRDWEATLTRTGAGLVAFSAVSGAALYKTAQAASDLSETVNKTNVIFGDASSKVIAYGDDASQSIGQSKQAALEAASTFGGLAKGIGLTADESADFAIKLTTLSSDLASFGNTTPEEAVLALGSALRGESEPIRRYNVLLNEAAIKQEAYASGIAKQGEELTEQQKVQARYNVILKQTSDAQGDFARTSDGAANQQRILSAQLKDLQANVGTGLLPIFTKLVSTVNSAVGAFSSLSPETQNLVGTIAGIATVGAGATGVISLIAGQAVKAKQNFADAAVAIKDFAASLRTAEGAGKAIQFAAITAGVTALAIAQENRRKAARELFEANIDVNDSLRIQIRDTIELLQRQREAEDNAIGIRVTERFALGSDAFVDAAFSVEELESKLADLAGQLEATGVSQDKVAEFVGRSAAAYALQSDALRGTIESQESYGEEAIKAKEASEAYSGSIAGRVVSALRGLSSEQDDAAAATEKHTKSVGKLAQEYDEFYDRVLGRRDTVRDAATAQLDVADALAKVGDAQRNLSELQQSGTATADEIAQAQRDVARATLDYSGSVDDAVGAIRDAIAIQAGYEQGTKNSKKETEAYIGALKAQRDTLTGPLRDALSAYIEGLERIPATKTTTVIVDTTQAEANIQRTQEALNRLTASAGATQGELFGAGSIEGRRALGGPVSAGRTYLVGEKGPELFVPGSSGSIVPNHALKGSGGTALGGGGEVIHVHFHGPVAGSQRAMERMMVDALKSARRRGDRDVA